MFHRWTLFILSGSKTHETSDEEIDLISRKTLVVIQLNKSATQNATELMGKKY